MAKLKDKVLEFAEIAKSLPENLRPICFELLLRRHLESLESRSAGTPSPKQQSDKPTDPSEQETVEDTAGKQEDLTAKDLHVKVKKFIAKYSVSLAQLNNVFYKEGQEILPLYEDLKTTRLSEGQIRIALLQALQHAIQTGSFEADVEQVRGECTDRKCYDANNFANNFRNNKTLFDFDKYTKSTAKVRLSEDGRKELAELIKELQ